MIETCFLHSRILVTVTISVYPARIPAAKAAVGEIIFYRVARQLNELVTKCGGADGMLDKRASAGWIDPFGAIFG